MTGITGYKCAHCQDTGELGGLGYLDCGFCDAATTRAALNEMVKALGPMTREDLAWALYQAGEKAADMRLAAERTELVASLYAMRGWVDGLMDFIDVDDPDLQLDLAKANMLLKMYRKG